MQYTIDMRFLHIAPYLEQHAAWPAVGRHVLAQHDEDTVVVYQAYRPSIGNAAVLAQQFGGGGFSLSRMSWIKPNFLWMMYRCGWASKEGQEVVLAVWLQRAGFDHILAAAVPSSFDPARYADRAAWSRAVKTSSVRVQWDPDHDPHGKPVERRAIQLGLRGDMLAHYARDWIAEIRDITPAVRTMRDDLTRGGLAALHTPRETVYPVAGQSDLGRRAG
jgi:uncharacterized protein DUF4291